MTCFVNLIFSITFHLLLQKVLNCYLASFRFLDSCISSSFLKELSTAVVNIFVNICDFFFLMTNSYKWNSENTRHATPRTFDLNCQVIIWVPRPNFHNSPPIPPLADWPGCCPHSRDKEYSPPPPKKNIYI